MERRRRQCQGGEHCTATVVSESAVPERVPVIGWVGDTCDCSRPGPEAEFEFPRFRGSHEFEAFDRSGQLDAAATIKFWKFTRRRRRKWLAAQLPTARCSPSKVRGASAVVHARCIVKRNTSHNIFLISAPAQPVVESNESELWRWKLPEPG